MTRRRHLTYATVADLAARIERAAARDGEYFQTAGIVAHYNTRRPAASPEWIAVGPRHTLTNDRPTAWFSVRVSAADRRIFLRDLARAVDRAGQWFRGIV
mgnify:FL=1